MFVNNNFVSNPYTTLDDEKEVDDEIDADQTLDTYLQSNDSEASSSSTTHLAEEECKLKSEHDKLIERTFSQKSPLVIQDLVISYFATSLGHPRDVSLIIENAKSFVIVGHLSDRKELKLIGLYKLYEICRLMKDMQDQPKRYTWEYRSRYCKLEESISLYNSFFKNFDLEPQVRELAADKKLLRLAMKNIPDVVECAPDAEKNNYETVLELVKTYNYAPLKYTNEKFRYDPTIMLELIKSDPHTAAWCLFRFPKFCDDSSIMLELLKITTEGLRDLSKRLRSDRDFALSAVKIRGESLWSLDRKLSTDYEILIAALSDNESRLSRCECCIARFCINECLEKNEIAEDSLKKEKLLLLMKQYP